MCCKSAVVLSQRLLLLTIYQGVWSKKRGSDRYKCNKLAAVLV